MEIIKEVFKFFPLREEAMEKFEFHLLKLIH